jgi:hypothetical protein
MSSSFQEPSFLSNRPDGFYPFASRLEDKILALGRPITATLRVVPTGQKRVQVVSIARDFP